LAFVIGLVCAVMSAFGTNLSFLYKHRGAVAAPDVDMRHPLRSAIDLFRSKWWTIGWAVAVSAFAAHVAALTLLPLSVAQAVLSGGFVLLAVLAERFFGFDLGRRQWFGVVLVAVSLALLAVTGEGSGSNSDYSLVGMILFEGGALALGLAFLFSHRIPRLRAQRGVLLGAAAGLGFGISDVAIKALSGDLDSGLPGLLSAWSVLIVLVGIGAFFASARSLQVGEGVAVIAVTSVAANLSAILAGVLVFGDPLGKDALVVIARVTAFVLVLLAAVLMPAPVRAGEAMEEKPSADTRPPSRARLSWCSPLEARQ
jgi:drug/metabolite transporter (DMT)-like permease